MQHQARGTYVIMNSKFFIGILLGVVLLAFTAKAAAPLDIIATVNNDLITVYDIETRVDLMRFSATLPNSPELRQRLRGEALKALIDESLKRQEAEELGIEVSDDELQKSIDFIAEQNKIPPESFESHLKKNGVVFSALQNEIRSGLAWRKVVSKHLSRGLKISESEIDAELDRLQAEANEDSYLLAEIFIPIGTDNTHEDAEKTAWMMVEDIRKGASFQLIAKQFSKSASAATGGDIGWIPVNQLDGKVREQISKMNKGTLSPPIETDDGFYLMLVRDKRTGQDTDMVKLYDLYQIILPNNLDSRNDLIAEAQAEIKDCQTAAEFADDNNLTISGTLTDVVANQLDANIQSGVSNLAKNQTSQPIQLSNGIGLYTICDIKSQSANLPDRDKIARKIRNDILFRRANQYLSEIRREAIIDFKDIAQPAS